MKYFNLITKFFLVAIVLAISLLPFINIKSVKAQEPLNPHDVKMPSVIITDTGDYLEVDNGVKVYQFGYDGNNTILSEDRTLTIMDGEHFDLSIGGNSFNLVNVDVSYSQTQPDKQNRQDTFINETYLDDSGLSYSVTYKLSYATPPTVECKINSNSTDDYQANWNFNEYGNQLDSPNSNKLLFDNGIKIDWNDVSKSLGDITTPTIQSMAPSRGKIIDGKSIKSVNSTSINFDVGNIQQGKSLTIDPGLGDADPWWVPDPGDVTNHGSGNWSDATHHWASVSNGTPSSGNLPGSGSDVHFDSHSLTSGSQTVTVDA